jgi:hypothetical protein
MIFSRWYDYLYDIVLLFGQIILNLHFDLKFYLLGQFIQEIK